MDHIKIIKALIDHFIGMEGTVYLGSKRELAPVDGLSEPKLLELTRLRDEVRKLVGWERY